MKWNEFKIRFVNKRPEKNIILKKNIVSYMKFDEFLKTQKCIKLCIKDNINIYNPSSIFRSSSLEVGFDSHYKSKIHGIRFYDDFWKLIGYQSVT